MIKIDTTRKTFPVEVQNLGAGLSGTVDEIIEQLLAIKAKAEKLGYRDLTIDFESYGYNDGWEFSAMAIRDESDEEYEARIEQLREDAEESERLRLEKLQRLADQQEEQRKADLEKLQQLAKKLGKELK